MAKSSAVINPNLGLYYGLDALMVPSRGLQDGRNFRIKQGKVGNVNLGWQEHSTIDFVDPIMLIDTFYIRSASQKQVIATTKNVYEYDPENDTALYLNRRYATGTVAHDGANPTVVTGTGTSWTTAGIKPGDMIHFGNAAQRSLSATWFEIDVVTDNTHLTLTGDAGAALGAGASYTIRRTFTGDITDFWDSATFTMPDDGAGGVGDDLFFLTNGAEFVHTWDGSATQLVEQSGMNFLCKQLFVYKNMMIYANLSYGGESLPTGMINSDVGLPLNAGDDGTGLSEQFRVNDGVFEILEVEDMGDNLVFYSRDHVTLCQFVGDPLIFIFREAGEGVGPLAGRLVADFGDYHEFIGADAQYLFDGVTLSTVNQQVWREVLRTRDASRQHFGFHHFDEENGELIWAIPLTSDAGVGDEDAPPEQAFTEHYLEEVGDKTPTPFSRRDFPFLTPGTGTVQGALTWDEITETWDQMVIRWNDSQLFTAFPLNLMGDANGTLWKINTIQTGDGSFLPSYVRSGRRATGSGRERNLLTRVYAFAEQLNSTLDVTVRMMDHAAGPATIIDTKEFDTTLPEGRHFTVHYRRGRFFENQFGTDGEPWTISGWDTDIRPGGMR